MRADRGRRFVRAHWSASVPEPAASQGHGSYGSKNRRLILLALFGATAAVALITVVIGGLYIRESRSVRIWDEVGGETQELRQVAGESSEAPVAPAI